MVDGQTHFLNILSSCSSAPAPVYGSWEAAGADYTDYTLATITVIAEIETKQATELESHHPSQ